MHNYRMDYMGEGKANLLPKWVNYEAVEISQPPCGFSASHSTLLNQVVVE